MSNETFQPTSYSQAAYFITRDFSRGDDTGKQALAEALRQYGACLDSIARKAADVAKGAADIADAIARGADPIDWVQSSAAEVAQLIARRRALVETVGLLCFATGVENTIIDRVTLAEVTL